MKVTRGLIELQREGLDEKDKQKIIKVENNILKRRRHNVGI